MHRFAVEQDLAGIRYHRTTQGLDEGQFPCAVVPYDGEDFVGPQFEVRVVEGDHAPVALGEAARLQNRYDAHAEILRIHWSIVTATMIRTPTAKSCQSTSKPLNARPLRNTPTMSAPMSVPMIEPRPPNSEVPPITTAVIESRFAVCPACGLTPPMRPIRTQAATAQISPARA